MLDFRRHRQVSPRASAGLERRMIALVGGSALVVLLMVAAGNSRNWHWLAPPSTGAQPAVPRQIHRVDNAADDGVVLAADQPEHPNAAAAPGDVASTVEPADAAASKSAARDDRLFPGVRADYLRAVRDDTVFRPAESDGWYHLLALLAHTTNQKLVDASLGPVTYLQLDQQSNEYRGRLVTVGGVVRAARLMKAPANAFDVKQYYQLWLQPDRGSSELIALYCLELPAGFPLGTQLDSECSATGFFFKRWAYSSRGGITTAPLVMARTLDWHPPVAAVPRPAMPLVEQLALAAAVAILLAVVALAFIVWRGRTSSRPSPATSHGADDRVGAALAALESQTTSDDTRAAPH